MPPPEDRFHNTEFLVHISAPTSVTYDNTYLQQASSALSFVPVNRIQVGSVSWPRQTLVLVDCDEVEKVVRIRSLQDGKKRKRFTSPTTPSPTRRGLKPTFAVPSPSTRLFYSAASKDPISTPRGILQTPKSSTVQPSPLPLPPVVQVPNTGLRTPQKSSSLFRPTSSECDDDEIESEDFSFSIPDSQPSASVRPPPPRPCSTQSSPPTASTPILSVASGQHTPPPAPSSAATSQTPHHLPRSSTFSTPSSIHSTIIPSAFPRLSAGALLMFSTPAPKASSLSLSAPVCTPSPPSLLTISTLTSPPQKPPAFNPLCPLLSIINPPYRVYSPSPSSSSNPPQTPPLLREFVAQHLPGKFRLLQVSQTRELRQWERGYWRINLRSWGDPRLKETFWKGMVDMIVNGRLGTVSMNVETEEHTFTRERWDDSGWWGGGGGRVARRRKEKLEASANVVRVYCYGGCVEEIWAVLHVHSFKHTKGAVWIDAAGEVVIEI